MTLVAVGVLIGATIVVVILYCIPHFAGEADRRMEKIIKGD